MGSNKATEAVMWECKGGYNITLGLPFFFSGGEPVKIKDVELPRAMTSNQFNNFIGSPEGKDWAKEEFIKEYPHWADRDWESKVDNPLTRFVKDNC